MLREKELETGRASEEDICIYIYMYREREKERKKTQRPNKPKGQKECH